MQAAGDSRYGDVENLPRTEQPVESAQLIEQRQYLQRVLEDNQQQMSDALAAQDMETYKKLRDQRSVHLRN
jgi:hypothetical protein